MKGPLAVRVRTNGGVVDRHVSLHTTGLKFRKTAPGGHADMSCRIDLPSGALGDLGPTDKVFVYDEWGKCLWDGYVNNPGTRSGKDGQGYDLVAVGGMSRLTDQSDRFVYLDKGLGSWIQDTYADQVPGATAQVGAFPDGTGGLLGEPALYLQFNSGQPVQNNTQVGMIYKGMVGGSMEIGGLVTAWDAGRVDAGYLMAWNTWPSFTKLAQTAFTNAGNFFAIFAGGPSLDTGMQQLAFRALRTGLATTVGNNDYWAASGRISVLGQLVDRFGVDRNMLSVAHVVGVDSWIYAHEVVEDLLGRALTFCDPQSAVIEAAGYPIDQLAYADGAKPQQVLDDLSLFEADFLYEILECRLGSDRHRFNFRAWPTGPRYIIPPSIPVDQPGSQLDLCNRVMVSWADEKGNQQVTPVTSVVPALGGRVRDADPITLPEGKGSVANAQRVGQQILAAKAAAPKAARVTVDEPVLDLVTGRQVLPHEWEAGYVARVMSTGDDLRVTEVEYDDDSQSVDATLGEPALTTDQWIARLAHSL